MLTALLLLATLVGCLGTPAPAGPSTSLDPVLARQTLQRWSAAALSGDRPGFDAAVSTRDPAFAATAARLYDDLRRLGSVGWELGPGGHPLSPTRSELLGPGAVVTAATVTWAPAPGTPALRSQVWITWVVEDGGPRLAGTVDGPGTVAAPAPAWWLEDVTVQQWEDVAVLTGGSADAEVWRGRVERAVEAVDDAALDAARPDGRAPPVLVQVPSTRALAERVLGSSQLLQGAAAVTSADPGGALPVVVDPAANLTGDSWVFLLTHELVHVRTSSPGTGSPRWLVEGLAESVARGAQPDLLTTAPEQAAAASGVGALPSEEELRDRPEAAYLCSWVAVELLQERVGRAALLDVVADTARGRPVADVLLARGTSTAELEEDVEQALRDLAAGREVPALR